MYEGKREHILFEPKLREFTDNEQVGCGVRAHNGNQLPVQRVILMI